jgi:hypothetical protein
VEKGEYREYAYAYYGTNKGRDVAEHFPIEGFLGHVADKSSNKMNCLESTRRIFGCYKYDAIKWEMRSTLSLKRAERNIQSSKASNCVPQTQAFAKGFRIRSE